MGLVISRFFDFFSKRKLELVLVGLENSGKSTLLHQMSSGQSNPDTVPTVGLEVKIMKRGGVTMKVWDLGGGPPFRQEWTRYTRGCNVILFLVDATDTRRLSTARHELHTLLEDRELAQTPLLVIGNKVDSNPHMSKEEIIKGLNLDYITEQPWEVQMISGLRGTNVDRVVEWLIQKSKERRT
eukprot:TRINITY_DN18621_c0_g1::TRINITY_DN18621_c0_g1_i1::g.1041::m.1041 TRINITY_DN18621_c0_g1::TRINITY_DN18621_c0_g1_i1::g.1041  ORF type:complete len:183 (+),score=29.92,sp/Q66HA6/ARL8B_RAT/40.86/8e-47,Arf/PF00025.16/3.3e-44,Ras/PF00071.17/1.2e-12,Miro/PF08477.8/3.4e-11,G-alpha/PF00503.15/0.016,G-alpha/PF00503.15/0.0031,SRPRB/PF09439.5/2.7e-07,MMR_HSR1/PF01926.18/6.1e-07,GTP_EFTU/PF00009.22/26,GTP_EFTU/PF00009.22/2.1e-05,Gtr1_RagA/PF04670.7/1.6e-05,FeoB_N/PF02421.13/0.14,FeoB_N/PF02421.13/7.7e+02 TRINI